MMKLKTKACLKPSTCLLLVHPDRRMIGNENGLRNEWSGKERWKVNNPGIEKCKVEEAVRRKRRMESLQGKVSRQDMAKMEQNVKKEVL